MKEIGLSKGKAALVDDEDYERLNQHKWYAGRSGSTFYAQRDVYSGGRKKPIWMHREILNAPKGTLCDHINSNALDNRRENLRLCTHTQNMRNRKHPHKNNKLGIKGVYWNKRRKKFQTSIKVNNVKIHLGYFNVLGDADSVYRKAEEKYYGEFARGITV